MTTSRWLRGFSVAFILCSAILACSGRQNSLPLTDFASNARQQSRLALGNGLTAKGERSRNEVLARNFIAAHSRRSGVKGLLQQSFCATPTGSTSQDCYFYNTGDTLEVVVSSTMSPAPSPPRNNSVELPDGDVVNFSSIMSYGPGQSLLGWSVSDPAPATLAANDSLPNPPGTPIPLYDLFSASGNSNFQGKVSIQVRATMPPTIGTGANCHEQAISGVHVYVQGASGGPGGFTGYAGSYGNIDSFLMSPSCPSATPSPAPSPVCNSTHSSLSPFAHLEQRPDIQMVNRKSKPDPDTLAYARRLQNDFPELRDRQIIELESTWRSVNTENNTTPLINSVIPNGATTNFACTGGVYSTSWFGYAPPNCDDGRSAGPFRGVFSSPSKSEAEAYITLPNSQSTLPSGGCGNGFVYLDAWPAPGKDNGEGGFAYSASSGSYAPYAAAPGRTDTEIPNYAFKPEEVGIDERPDNTSDAVTIPSQPSTTCSSKGGCLNYRFAIVTSSAMYLDSVRLADPGMDPKRSGCCIFQRMSTIAVSPAQFYVGALSNFKSWSFGPVVWKMSRTYTNGNPDGAGTSSGWTIGTAKDRDSLDTAGYINFPNCPLTPYQTVVRSNDELESDTIRVPPNQPTSC